MKNLICFFNDIINKTNNIPVKFDLYISTDSENKRYIIEVERGILQMKKFFSDFKAFISRGNILDMAVGVVIGGAFGYAAHYLIVNWNGFFVTCTDGNRPDKNGCCAGEVYTDAGGGWMVCCPEIGENCFPPVK